MASTQQTHSKACCTLPPVVSDYTPKGAHVTLDGGLDAYVVGPADAATALVMTYDIFGYHPATKQTVDLLAHGLGARVYMPDFFEGNAWSLANFPPKDGPAFMQWVTTAGGWSRIKPLLSASIAHAKAHGAHKVGVVGLCWGSLMAVQAADELAADLAGAALLHPAFLKLELIQAAKRPLCILPSKDEPDMADVEAHLKSTGKLYAFRRFDDMHHGWCGARADFENELNRQRTHEAVDEVVAFFTKAFAA
ncbi:hypothetical protein H9P43_007705 [Blastocladiella emersonii ATCC 22665]|nr:hypothetical protein H9P43_007705 [Blastocladiella emersonii ATCC 22665]